jgi:Rieske Fe-S protein
MAACEVCGNEYGQRFDREKYAAGNYEYILERLSPNCAHCGCQVAGHGRDPAGFFSAVLFAPLGIAALVRGVASSTLPQLEAEQNGELMPEPG